jgi:hypothetical protein
MGLKKKSCQLVSRQTDSPQYFSKLLPFAVSERMLVSILPHQWLSAGLWLRILKSELLVVLVRCRPCACMSCVGM